MFFLIATRGISCVNITYLSDTVACLIISEKSSLKKACVWFFCSEHLLLTNHCVVTLCNIPLFLRKIWRHYVTPVAVGKNNHDILLLWLSACLSSDSSFPLFSLRVHNGAHCLTQASSGLTLLSVAMCNTESLSQAHLGLFITEHILMKHR